MNKTKLILLIVIIIVAIAIIAVGIVLGLKLLSKKCEPLTPLALSRFEAASNERSEYGEKCQMSGDSYLLILEYKSSDSAEKAKKALELATPGEVENIEDDVIWINKDGNSSVFWTDKKLLGILVMPGEDDEDIVEKQLDKAFKKVDKY